MKVVYSATRNLYPYMLPSIKSLLDHNNVEKIYLMIEDDEMPYDVPDVCECINISNQQYFTQDGPNMRSMFTYAAMMRATYADLFWDEDRIIQLDVDTIICDSLQPLWDLCLADKWFAAVPEYKSNYRPFGPMYYNVGVAVFNLRQMRKDGAVQMLVDWLNTTSAMCVDQDALNFFALRDVNRATVIPIRYNECFATGETDDPAVVHYAGYPDWMRRENLPRSEYLDAYRYLFQDGYLDKARAIQELEQYIQMCDTDIVRKSARRLILSPSGARTILRLLEDAEHVRRE